MTAQQVIPARLQPCPACGRHTLFAVSCGLPVRADPEQLTINEEIAARIRGLEIYDAHAYGLPRRLYLEYRDLTRVKGSRRYPVVAAHPCGHMRRPAADAGTELIMRAAPPVTDGPSF